MPRDWEEALALTCVMLPVNSLVSAQWRVCEKGREVTIGGNGGGSVEESLIDGEERRKGGGRDDGAQMYLLVWS